MDKDVFQHYLFFILLVYTVSGCAIVTYGGIVFHPFNVV